MPDLDTVKSILTVLVILAFVSARAAEQTPSIDRLASEGVRFTSGYCSASTRTPTRFSLLTGTYAFRQKGTGISPPNGPAIVKPGTEIMPSILPRAGYAAAHPEVLQRLTARRDKLIDDRRSRPQP